MAEATIQKLSPSCRITLPEEIRRTLHVWIGDSIALQPDGETVVMRKYEQACIFCGSTDGLTELRGKHVCSRCRAGLAKLPPPKPYIPFDQCT